MWSTIKLDRALVAKGGLYEFQRLAWPIVDPSPFVGNWHLEEVCKHLEAVSRLEIKRLVVNMPPGTGKSITINVMWPCWHWINNPSDAWIFASFDDHLVNRDASKAIQLLRSTWFVERWGELLPGASKPTVTDFRNARGGHRLGTTPKGKATGHHADIHVVDDPIKPLDAAGGSTMSRVKLEEVRTWYHGTMSSRFRDQRTGRRVVVMQRLHEEDLAGECIAAGYVHLRLPMRHEPAEHCVTKWGGDQRTEPQELLFPERFPEEEVTRLEAEMGPDVAPAQLQQRPTRQGGGAIREEWLRFWHPTDAAIGPPLPKTGVLILSVDCAFKDKPTSDFVAMQVWLADFEGRLFLLDQLRDRLDLPDTSAGLLFLASVWPAAYDKLIEDKANGPGVEQTLRAEVPGLTLVAPLGGKIARVNACKPHFASGRVYLPAPAPHTCKALAPDHPYRSRFSDAQAAYTPDGREYDWVLDYVLELTRFPNWKHDDMVDATTQAILYLKRDDLADFSAAMAKIRGEQ